MAKNKPAQMRFINKQTGTILFLSDVQDPDLWEKGYISLNNGEWLFYYKMADFRPIREDE
jgi:hypothetical protein